MDDQKNTQEQHNVSYPFAVGKKVKNKTVLEPREVKSVVPEASTSARSFFKVRNSSNIKYSLLNPKKPYVKKRDGELPEGIPLNRKMPEDLKDKMTQEEYEILVGTTFESCEEIYGQLIEQINAPEKAIKEITKFEEMIPYLPEVPKFKRLTNMIVSDMRYFKKEIDSIRALYKKFITAEGKTKPEINREDSYILELITDIKLRFFVAGNRIKNVLLPAVQHVSDFYTSMKLRYYSVPEHFDSAPDDIKEFLKTRINNYTNTEVQQMTDKEQTNAQQSFNPEAELKGV